MRANRFAPHPTHSLALCTTVYRNQYDTDVTTFSPQGRLFQLEYAMEAVKQGSPTVGLRSKTHAVLVAFKRSPDELASYQEKLFKIDNHMAISISGLTADARFLCKYMRTECLNHNFVYGSTKQTGRLVTQIADMHQRCTQDGGYERRRPFGVGLLVMGYDKTGPHMYQTCPSANFYEYKSQAIGARSRQPRHSERHFETFVSPESVGFWTAAPAHFDATAALGVHHTAAPPHHSTCARAHHPPTPVLVVFADRSLLFLSSNTFSHHATWR